MGSSTLWKVAPGRLRKSLLPLEIPCVAATFSTPSRVCDCSRLRSSPLERRPRAAVLCRRSRSHPHSCRRWEFIEILVDWGPLSSACCICLYIRLFIYSYKYIYIYIPRTLLLLASPALSLTVNLEGLQPGYFTPSRWDGREGRQSKRGSTDINCRYIISRYG